MYDMPRSSAAARIDPLLATASSRSAFPGPITIVPSPSTMRMRGLIECGTGAMIEDVSMRRASIVLALLFTACTTFQSSVSVPVLADRLFCGLAIPGGGEVTEAEWRAFIAEEVTPRFPDGLTIWRAEGQWRGADGVIVREPTLVIEILHHHDVRVDRKIIETAEAYRKRFRQEAVMRVTLPARMELID
jgi:hypothetical protein